MIDLHFELDEEPTPSLVAKIGRHQLLIREKKQSTISGSKTPRSPISKNPSSRCNKDKVKYKRLEIIDANEREYC